MKQANFAIFIFAAILSVFTWNPELKGMFQTEAGITAQAQFLKTDSVPAALDRINKFSEQHLKPLLLAYIQVGRKDNQNDIEKMNFLIRALDKFPAITFTKEENILPAVISYGYYMSDKKRDDYLPAWTTRLLAHGIDASRNGFTVDDNGNLFPKYLPLIVAIDLRHLPTIKLLMSSGHDSSATILTTTDLGEMCPIRYIEEKLNNPANSSDKKINLQILAALSQSWEAYINYLKQIQTRPATSTPERYALESLIFLDKDIFNTLVSSATPAEQKSILGYLQNSPKSAATQEKITLVEKLNGGMFSITRLKLAMGAIAAVVATTFMYKWSTSSHAEKSEDILINNTGKSIFVSYDNSTFEEIKPGTAFNLAGKEGSLSIKSTKEQETSDLSIDLTKYSANRTDNFLNLTISKNWLTWFFGPLSASARWAVKGQTEAQ